MVRLYWDTEGNSLTMLSSWYCVSQGTKNTSWGTGSQGTSLLGTVPVFIFCCGMWRFPDALCSLGLCPGISMHFFLYFSSAFVVIPAFDFPMVLCEWCWLPTASPLWPSICSAAVTCPRGGRDVPLWELRSKGSGDEEISWGGWWRWPHSNVNVSECYFQMLRVVVSDSKFWHIIKLPSIPQVDLPIVFRGQLWTFPILPLWLVYLGVQDVCGPWSSCL